MSSQNTSPSSHGWLSKLGMFLLAILVVGPWEGAKRLNKWVYEGDTEDEVLYTLLAALGTIFGSIEVGKIVLDAGHTALFVPAGFLALFLCVGYIIPLAWLGLVKWVWLAIKNSWKEIRTFAQAHFENLAAGCVKLVSWLPGSGFMWNKLLAADHKSWLARLLKVVLYPTLVLCTGWLGYSVYLMSHGLATGLLGVGATVLGGALGLLVFAILGDVLVKFLHYGKVPAIAVLLGLPLSLVAGAFILTLGSGWQAAAIAAVLTLVLGVAYIIPGLLLIFSDHLLEWLIETLKPMLEAAYEQKENPARRLSGQLINLFTTAAAGYGLFMLCGTISLPLWGTAVALALGVSLAYTLGGKIWDWEGGNYLAGAVTAGLVGWGVEALYQHFGLWFGMYGAITVGVLAAALVFFLLYPLALIGWQKFSALPGVSTAVNALSGWLVGAHEEVWKKFDAFVTKCANVYSWGYRDDKTSFNKLVLHSSNIVFTLLIPASLYFGVKVFGPHYLVAAHPIIGGIVALFVAGFTYLLGGRLLLKSGVELNGGIVAVGAGIAVGAVLASATVLGMWVAAPLGVMAAGLTFFLGYPGLIIGSRAVCDPWLTNLLLPGLQALYEREWKRFGGWWDGFVGVYHGLVKWLGEVFSGLAPYWNGFIALCREAWGSVFGR